MDGREDKPRPNSPRTRRTRQCALEALEARTLLSSTLTVTPAVANAGVTAGPSGFSPAQVLQAYGFDAAAPSIGAVGGDGTGQTIAIVEAYNDPTLAADVHTFDQQFGITDPRSLSVIDEFGGTSTPAVNSTWSSETALDVEWAHAVAPGANILVVEAKSDQLMDLLTAVNTARNIPTVSVVSMSWGVSEFPNETNFDSIFTTPAGHKNVTFVASSGDTATANGQQWPSTSPNVVSVGGSTLNSVWEVIGDPTSGENAQVGMVYSETPSPNSVSGVSAYETKPSYQDATSIANGRTTPDVVYDASVSPGFAVYDSGSGGWETLGGTSSGAPQWGGLVAIADQVRASAGRNSLDGISQTLPAIYSYYRNNSQATIQTATTPVFVFAGSLIAFNGASQTTGVISALVNNSTFTKSTPQGSSDQSISALLASAPHRRVHPFVLNIASPSPAALIHFAGPISNSSRSLQAALPTFGSFTGNAVPVGKASLSGTIGGGSPPPPLLTMALPELTATAISKSDAVAQLMASIYGEIQALGTGNIVPVGNGSAMLLAEPHRTSWFIAHVNVAATFGDSINSFINECAMLPAQSSMLADTVPTRGHLRAWVVTIGILALDGLVLYYLVSRRRQTQDSDQDLLPC